MPAPALASTARPDPAPCASPPGSLPAKACAVAQAFCSDLSPAPRLPTVPVYGANNWYNSWFETTCPARWRHADGEAVFTHRARVSAHPVNKVWPGCQRPKDQTEIASFASWDMTQPVEVHILSTRPVHDVRVRPAAAGIKPQVEGNTIRFIITNPGQFTVQACDVATPIRDIQVRRCVVWNDWGKALEIGIETVVEKISDILFEDCDLIHVAGVAIDVTTHDRARCKDLVVK